MDGKYNRAAEDLGNIVALEHVNVTVPDQQLATLFYVGGLGLTRDPYLMTGINNMWVNIGRSQFHLPTAKPQIVRGHIGIVVPDRAALLERLSRSRKRLGNTCFEFSENDLYVDTRCPWGNRIRCFEPNPYLGPMTLGIAYVEFEVPPGTANNIVRFYRKVIGTPACIERDAMGSFANVPVGRSQNFRFRETDRPIPDYDGHHVQVYVADFSGPHRQLCERGLVFEESSQHQYRFRDLVDPDDGRPLFTIEHEVRSMTHPLFMRPLVNRDPTQNIMEYRAGHDAFI